VPSILAFATVADHPISASAAHAPTVTCALLPAIGNDAEGLRENRETRRKGTEGCRIGCLEARAPWTGTKMVKRQLWTVR
jgi:hypothetical protein